MRSRFLETVTLVRGSGNVAKRWMLLTAAYLWRRLMFQTTFIAVTGSVGKTTTKELIAATLGALPCEVISNFASENTVHEIARTLLRVRRRHRFAVFEVATSRAGLIAKSARILSPKIAIVLAVAGTHTNNFATLEDTAAEKASLLRFLPPDGVAILNADDPRVAAMTPPPGVRIIRFGQAEQAEVRASSVTGSWPERLSFVATYTLGSGARSEQVQSQLVGSHWISSLLAAIAVARECGMPLDQIASRLCQIPPTAGRMDPQRLPNGAVVLRDEFNGSLDTYRAAFEALTAARAERKILVITNVVDSTEGWGARIRKIAANAAGVVDVLVLIGAFESAHRAANAAITAGLAPEAVRVCKDLREASELLRSELRSGDLVLLRGRVQDHLTRLYYAQLGDVACWKETCPKRILCDHCEELSATGGI